MSEYQGPLKVRVLPMGVGAEDLGSKRNRWRGRPKGSRPAMHCSHCGETGHNARTCLREKDLTPPRQK